MTRKAKREIAKARQRNASSRVADKWAMQRMAVDLGEKDTEIERLRAAIRWALGEEPDADGKWFGETYDEERAKYGWRKNLRRIAGLPTYTYDKATRSIAVSNGEETP